MSGVDEVAFTRETLRRELISYAEMLQEVTEETSPEKQAALDAVASLRSYHLRVAVTDYIKAVVVADTERDRSGDAGSH